MSLDHQIPNAVGGGDERAGQKDGDGVDRVMHMGESAHLAFGDDIGFRDAVKIRIGAQEADVELRQHPQEIVAHADFLGHAAGNLRRCGGSENGGRGGKGVGKGGMAGVWWGRDKKRRAGEGENDEARKGREIKESEKISGQVGGFLTALDFGLRAACEGIAGRLFCPQCPWCPRLP